MMIQLLASFIVTIAFAIFIVESSAVSFGASTY